LKRIGEGYYFARRIEKKEKIKREILDFLYF